ncbi:MAG: SEL1-like repeat protein, partial [Alphaproteobacteria bacterium]|nr:SEL1-like repeat protein [Alphaproteobacteria bacterium]
TNDTLSHALSSIESRKDEDAAALRRDAETASAIARLEDNFAKMEMRGTDPSIDRRLSSIERSLTDIVGRLEAPSHQTIEIEDNLKRLSQRIEASEARQREQVAELRAALTEGRGANPFDALPPHPVAAASQPSPFAPAPAPASSPFAPAANFDAPPFADMAPAAAHGFQQSADAFAPAFDAPPPAFGPEPTFGSGDFGAADPFAPPPPPPPLAEPDSYLSAARRSARAAAAAAEAERGNRMGRFSWGAASPAATEAKPAKAGSRKTLVWIGVLALLVVFAIVAGAILSQKVSTSSTHTLDAAFRKPAPAATTTPPVNNILPPDDVTSPPTDVTPPETTAPSPHAHGTTAPINVQPRTVAPAPVKPVPSQVTPSAVTAPPTTVPGKPQAATTPLDKLTQLANAGNGKAALVVGLKYLDGDGVAVSEADAAKWLERAAEQGLPVAQYRLGTMYERGRGVTRDPAKAVQWYQRAAQAGNRKAMHNLAVAYAGGQGTAKNLTEAARWFTMAAALGLADSQFNLAVLYERGMGVPQNLVDAYKWYSIAAAGGDTESKTRVDALATQLSPDDKAAAQRSAAAFRAKPLDPRSNVAPTINDVVGG